VIKRSKNPANISVGEGKLTFGDKLVLIRKHYNLSITKMTNDTGVVKSNISRYERNLVSPTIDFLAKLKKKYHINLNWLFDDQADMLLNKPSKKKLGIKPRKGSTAEIIPISYTTFGIPIFSDAKENQEYLLPVSGTISAGEPLEIRESETNTFASFPMSKSNDLDKYLVFKVNGLSMAPEIAHEDIVFIRQNNNWIDLNNKIVAVMIKGEMTLKKLIIDKPNQEVIFKPLNRDFNDIVISFEMMEGVFLVGELKAIRREYKK